MQNRLEEIAGILEGKSFEYQEKAHLQKKKYKFLKIKQVNSKILLTTDTRNFVFTESELDLFMENIEVLDAAKNALSKTNDIKRSNAVEVINKGAFMIPENCEILSHGIMNLFDVVSSGKATKEQLEAAKNASLLAGKLIDIEKIKLGYLMLNHK